ncbi:sulfatase-like hydrolase/transferase [Flavobacterium granuli]|uniref:Phosphoglycerol transferase MdoB-like AlkP superfamily enzyme n=1 Tax=Flavobacterium granuli TaxID=280093 RepID=A0ABU1S079_9FLAO|nr:sulfatase-like hydrolase/transferase [Flavobacterium granuli]MDR6844302.1 phosphoglycerol transferase MdoB-like AlkP superfamily enzyme [Flavobacterium granuli]
MYKLPSNLGRYSLLVHFVIWFLVLSQFLRIGFFLWQYDEVSWNIIDLARTLLTGLFFDLGTIVFISICSVLYYSILPNKWIGSLLDKVLVCFFTSLTVFILVFTFFAELTFWDEFKTRFNFIAVDYLIYTHEVVANIKQSYPLPILIGGVLLLTLVFLFLFYKRKAFATTFTSTVNFKTRLSVLIPTIAVALFFAFFINNNQAEWSSNRYNSEISKSGIYSFFAAFRNNQMKYVDFYTSIQDDKAFGLIRNKLASDNSIYSKTNNSIHRKITNSSPSQENKNVVFVLVESLSGSFLKEFGNTQNITPFLDSIAQKSIFFEDLYATGTRTVRGMEAVTLCIPPTPGQSIVKRPDNQNLYTVCSVFKSRKYDCNFFYGGDGYFDNMNAYFGGNGFTIYDRGRGSVLSDQIKTVRHNIDDKEVTFENAWGVCDEDIFNKMLKVADAQYKNNKPFFNFIMTTSNHRPFTYPSGKIDIPSGTSREGAVKYTDFALKELFNKAKKKPWFKNTVFVIIADHCASSAGKDEIDVANYHIPAFIVNFDENQNQKITKQCSQIDLWPTLFSLFHWNYDSDFFGKNVLEANYEQRALMGTYRKLVLMKKEKVMILSDQKKQAFYSWSKKDNSLNSIPMDQSFLDETIAWYQTADYLFTNKLLK